MYISKQLKTCAGLLAAAASMAIATPSLAERLTGPDVQVRYSDLDVDTVDGATLLLKRIRLAADSVCAPLDHGDIASRANVDRCNIKLTDAAVAKVNHPVLAAVYKSTHRASPTVAAVAE